MRTALACAGVRPKQGKIWRFRPDQDHEVSRIDDVELGRALTRAAAAVRLLGVEPVVTGLQPAMARALVAAGDALSGVVTRTTLQDAVAYALRTRR